MDRYDIKADRVLKKLIMEGKREFIIFPFGMLGMKVKNILNNRYGITEKYIVDNGLSGVSENPLIISLSEMAKRDIKGSTLLFASDHMELYNELRSQLAEFVKDSSVVDVFSPSMYFDKQTYHEAGYYPDVRFSALEAASKEIYRNEVEGAIAELGVYRGECSKVMARLMPDRKLFLFDTFEGFDERDNTGIDDSNLFESSAEIWNFKGTSVDLVLHRIGRHVDTEVRKGYFPETAKGLENERFAFVSLDTDLYEPIKAGLEFFWPRMNDGGYIFVHDFAGLEGVRKAVEEYCRSMKIGYTRLPDDCHTAVLAKPL